MITFESMATFAPGFYPLMADVALLHERVGITRYGRPEAALVALDEHEELRRRRAALSRAPVSTRLHAALAPPERDAGDGALGQAVTADGAWELVLAERAAASFEAMMLQRRQVALRWLLGPLRTDPAGVGHRLSGAIERLWAVSTPLLRIIYTLDECRHAVLVLDVAAHTPATTPR